MNHELADGAVQRLGAQIAEALFDQPGMTLTEQANRVRELRGDGPALLVPRNAGQDERARFEAWAQAQSHRGGNIPTARDAGHPDVYAVPLAQLTWKSWQAALSAQPSPGGQDAKFADVIEAARMAYRHACLCEDAPLPHEEVMRLSYALRAIGEVP